MAVVVVVVVVVMSVVAVVEAWPVAIYAQRRRVRLRPIALRAGGFEPGRFHHAQRGALDDDLQAL